MGVGHDQFQVAINGETVGEAAGGLIEVDRIVQVAFAKNRPAFVHGPVVEEMDATHVFWWSDAGSVEECGGEIETADRGGVGRRGDLARLMENDGCSQAGIVLRLFAIWLELWFFGILNPAVVGDIGD